MSRRRATGSAVLSVLLSFVASLLVGAAPAQASDVDKTIGYRCTSMDVGGSSAVRILADIPDRIAQGVTVPARRVRFRITVPRQLVAMLRDSGVSSVSAKGRGHYTIGTLERPIRHLHVPETDVPASGPMILKGAGRAASFAINRPGTVKVKVTRTLTATAIADGTPIALSCAVRRGQSRTLATVEVIR